MRTSHAHATLSSPSTAAHESAECDELSSRSFISSYGSTSAVSITCSRLEVSRGAAPDTASARGGRHTSFGIASSQLGLPAEKESSMTHCRKGS